MYITRTPARTRPDQLSPCVDNRLRMVGEVTLRQLEDMLSANLVRGPARR